MITEELRTRLLGLLGPRGVLEGAEVDAKYGEDWSGEIAPVPEIVLRPSSTNEVAQILALCGKAGQPVIVQGGRTGVVAGALPLPGEMIISMERMTRIGELDRDATTIEVEAGVTLQALQEHVEPQGYSFPLDLGSRGSCTIGGNIATNAGGNRVLRYGMIRDMVVGLEAVLADGSIVDAARKMLKDNAGYDLKQLFIGSEGTLGIVTRATLRLRPLPITQDAAFCAVTSFEAGLGLLSLLRARIGDALSAFEMMWSDCYREVLAAQPEMRPPLSPGAPFYILAETLGFDGDRDCDRLEQVLAEAIELGHVADAVVAQSQAEVAAFWRVRDGVAAAFRALQPCLSYDISLANSSIGDFANDVAELLADRWPEHRRLVFGHIGDGNVHILTRIGSHDQAGHELLDPLIYDLAGRYRGSISAEHGVGVLKRPYLSKARSPQEIAVMRTLKQALDPHGILAPGRIFDCPPRL